MTEVTLALELLRSGLRVLDGRRVASNLRNETALDDSY